MKRLLPIMAITFLLCFSTNLSFAQYIPQSRPSQEQYCFDYSKVLSSDLRREINTQGEALKRHFDIDFVVAIVPSLKGRDIVSYTLDLFSNWEIGKNTQGKKGMLILITMQEQKIKIEVGYDLEHIFTDIYVGQVEREMLKEFLEQADWERGFLATIENIVERIYYMLKSGTDVREIKEDVDLEYYSQGAGAKTIFDFGSLLKKPIPTTSEELKKYFGAQPTPKEAFQRYMEFNAKNMSDYTLDIFSDDSKIFFSHWRTSSGQRRSEAQAGSGRTYIVKQKGKYAVLMAPLNTSVNDFICQCPYFFIENEKGWQIDINTMGRALIMGGPSWHFLTAANPYMFAFKDYLLKTNRYYPKQGQKAMLGLTYSYLKKSDRGFYITPEYNSPAKESDIQEGDIFVSLDGVKITYPYQDWDMMKNYLPGDIVDVLVIRNGKKKNIKVCLESLKSWMDEFPYVKKEGDPWMGFYFGYSQPYERRIENVQLSVIDVIPGSPAAQAGFMPRDLIYTVPGSRDKHVGLNDYKALVKRVKPGDKVKFKVLRNLKERLEFEVVVGSYSVGDEGM